MYSDEKFRKAKKDFELANAELARAAREVLRSKRGASTPALSDLEVARNVATVAGETLNDWRFMRDCPTRALPYRKEHCFFCEHRIACLCTDEEKD